MRPCSGVHSVYMEKCGNGGESNNNQLPVENHQPFYYLLIPVVYGGGLRGLILYKMFDHSSHVNGNHPQPKLLARLQSDGTGWLEELLKKSGSRLVQSSAPAVEEIGRSRRDARPLRRLSPSPPRAGSGDRRSVGWERHDHGRRGYSRDCCRTRSGSRHRRSPSVSGRRYYSRSPSWGSSRRSGRCRRQSTRRASRRPSRSSSHRRSRALSPSRSRSSRQSSCRNSRREDHLSVEPPSCPATMSHPLALDTGQDSSVTAGGRSMPLGRKFRTSTARCRTAGHHYKAKVKKEEAGHGNGLVSCLLLYLQLVTLMLQPIPVQNISSMIGIWKTLTTCIVRLLMQDKFWNMLKLGSHPCLQIM
ncbi:uncharacterized protein RB166_006964 [Leptodactylus fuscus]|uniref:uncharacterized protein LOC142201136 n=1 Tax=Leptodactylus fuscus TaxID=238119 RepID=UPI003F4EC7F1